MNLLKQTDINNTDATGKKELDKESHHVFFIVVGVIASIGLWLFWGKEVVWWWAKYWHRRLQYENPTEMTLAELGQAGDLFGGINALFASFAFMGVAFAAYYQRKTFLQQQEDSKRSADAFQESLAQQKLDSKKNADANAIQVKTAQRDLFNSFFFRMLAEVDARMKDIDLTSASVFGDDMAYKAYSMEEKMALILKELKALSSGTKSGLKKEDEESAKALTLLEIQFYHEKIYVPNRKTLAPFLRNLFHTFVIIRESDMSYPEQCKYSKIARASINEQVLVIVMLNGLSEQGKNLKPIIEKYGLLKHLGDGQTSGAKKIAQAYYHPTAFQGFGPRNSYYEEQEKKAALN